MKTWPVYLFFLLLFEVIASILSKQYSVEPNRVLWGLAVSSELAVISLWLTALKHGIGLSRGMLLWSVTSSIVACLIGLVLYHEPITGKRIFGAVLGFAAVVFLIQD